MNFSDLHILFEHIDPPMQGSVHPCGIEQVEPGPTETGQFTKIKINVNFTKINIISFALQQ
jgi:hypothetical protein